MYHHRCREVRYLKRGERMRDFVFGYNDGAVTTLAILTALVSSSVISGDIIILGVFAIIIGSSMSIAFSDYISVKSQIGILKSFGSRKLSRHERDEIVDVISELDYPGRIAANTAASFAFAGLVALSPFFFLENRLALVVSIILTFSSIFLVGTVRARYTHGNPLKSGVEMIVIATLALITSFLIGIYIPLLLGLELI
jgi:VIT1/CCC1 family predicted Fe2+/Mn2+ transporter